MGREEVRVGERGPRDLVPQTSLKPRAPYNELSEASTNLL